jgi:hypothetical protein
VPEAWCMALVCPHLHLVIQPQTKEAALDLLKAMDNLEMDPDAIFVSGDWHDLALGLSSHGDLIAWIIGS